MNRLLLVMLLCAACSTPAAPPPAAAPGAGGNLNIQVVRLENARATDVARSVEASLADRSASAGGFKVAVQPDQNALILSGTTAQIEAALEVVAQLDTGPRR
ncbi:MAG TPA: secretin N-terminal domain-containing protein [Planctomycetota bacterium]|nr:secretin N-terminal domain-containing protein [Planctomycetota bacterium]